MKKSNMPTVFIGGVVISLILVLIFSFVFICFGEDIDSEKHNDGAGMPQIISPDVTDNDISPLPSLQFKETDGFLEIGFTNANMFTASSELHFSADLFIKEKNGSTVTVKSIRFAVYRGAECIKTGYVDLDKHLGNPIMSSGTYRNFRHYSAVLESVEAEDMTVVYVVTWTDAKGREGVNFCRHDFE